jgi:hypothetical protein
MAACVNGSYLHRAQHDLPGLGERLHQFHATCGDGGKKHLRRSDLLARAAVLHRSIDDEMMIAGTA